MQSSNQQVQTVCNATLDKLIVQAADSSFESCVYNFIGTGNIAGTSTVVTTTGVNPMILPPNPDPNPDPLSLIGRVQNLFFNLPPGVEPGIGVQSFAEGIDFQYYEAKDLLEISYINTPAYQFFFKQGDIAIKDTTYPPPTAPPGIYPVSERFKVNSMEFTRVSGGTFEVKASFIVDTNFYYQAVDALVVPHNGKNVLAFFVLPASSYTSPIDFGTTSSIIVDFSANGNAVVPFVIIEGTPTLTPDWNIITSKKGMVSFV